MKFYENFCLKKFDQNEDESVLIYTSNFTCICYEISSFVLLVAFLRKKKFFTDRVIFYYQMFIEKFSKNDGLDAFALHFLFHIVPP